MLFTKTIAHGSHIDLPRCQLGNPECANYEATIKADARGVHLNNRLSREYALNSGSLVHRWVSRFLRVELFLSSHAVMLWFQ